VSCGHFDGLEIMYTCGGDQQPDRCGLKIIDAMGSHCFIPISSHMTRSSSKLPELPVK